MLPTQFRRSVRWHRAPVRPYRPSVESLEEIFLLTITPIDTNYSTGSLAWAGSNSQLNPSSQDYPNALPPLIAEPPSASASDSGDSGEEQASASTTFIARSTSTSDTETGDVKTSGNLSMSASGYTGTVSAKYGFGNFFAPGEWKYTFKTDATVVVQISDVATWQATGTTLDALGRTVNAPASTGLGYVSILNITANSVVANKAITANNQANTPLSIVQMLAPGTYAIDSEAYFGIGYSFVSSQSVSASLQSAMTNVLDWSVEPVTLQSLTFGNSSGGASGPDFYAITSDSGSDTYADDQWDILRVSSDNVDKPQEQVLFGAGSNAYLTADFGLPASLNPSTPIEVRATDDEDGFTLIPTYLTPAPGGKLLLLSAPLKQSFGQRANFYDDFSIKWQLSTDGGQTWIDAGQSDNPLYVSSSTKPQPDPDSKMFFITVVDSEINATLGQDESDRTQIVTDTWDLFVGNAVREFSPQEPFSDGTEYGTELRYYGTARSSTDPTGQQLSGVGYTQNITVQALLQSGDGECGPWAGLFLDMLLVSGVGPSSTRSVDGIPGADTFVTVIPSSSEGFIVNDWTFSEGGTHLSLVPDYPYVDQIGLSYDVTKNPGVEGQDSLDPKAVFENHQIALIDGRYYDPSYGLSYSSLADMAAQDIAGYYKVIPSGIFGLGKTYVIQKASAGLNTLVPEYVDKKGKSRTVTWGSFDGPPSTPITPISDSGSPASSVVPAAPTTTSRSFAVTMSGNDGADGSGLATFSLYVSTNGGPFVLFQSDIPAQSTTGGNYTGSVAFAGAPGNTYSFYSVATDLSDATEYFMGTAQATVTVLRSTTLTGVGGTGSQAGTGNLMATLTSDGTPIPGATVTFTLTNGANTATVGSATTNASGIATLSNVSMIGFDVGAYPGAVGAAFAADLTFSGATAVGNLTVKQASVLPSPTPIRIVVAGEHPFFQRKLNGKGKPIGKSVLAGFTFDFGVALETSAADSARYQLATTTIRKIKGKKVTVLHPITNFSVTYLAASDALQIKLGSRQAFPTGGRITILSGLTTALGGQLTGPAVFNITKGGKSVVPA